MCSMTVNHGKWPAVYHVYMRKAANLGRLIRILAPDRRLYRSAGVEYMAACALQAYIRLGIGISTGQLEKLQ
jgi:hypothetical protein